MKNVLEFLSFATSHASPDRIPSGSKLCVPLSHVGSDGVWQYLYGTTGVRCTQSLLNRKYITYYSLHGWTAKEYKTVTQGWADHVIVCDCQGVEDYFSDSDTNAKGNYKDYCEDKGRIKDIDRPYVYGEALFCGSSPSTITHVGWVCGFTKEGEVLVIHERGISHGCVIEPLSKSGKTWTYRGLMTKRYSYEQPKQDQPVYVRYTGATYTNVRNSPSGEIIGQFRSGEQAIRISEDGDWSEIVLYNQPMIIRGWAKSTYIREVI